jgi:hypothetical protein
MARKNPNRNQLGPITGKPLQVGELQVDPVKTTGYATVYDGSGGDVEALGFAPRAAVFIGSSEEHEPGWMTHRVTREPVWTGTSPYEAIIAGAPASVVRRTGVRSSPERQRSSKSTNPAMSFTVVE